MSETDIDNGTDGGSTRTPAYVSFATLQSLLKALKTDGVPPQIDRSVLNKFSGGVQGQMKMALRSLDLMDGDIPTDHLRKLVEAYETPAFDDLLAERLRASYPYVFKLDLMTATPTMFADAFKNATNAKEDVLRKCRTFFLHAAKKANIPMGNRLASGSVPRSPNGAGRRKSKAKSTPETEPQDKQQNKADQQPISDKAMEYKLVDLMKESDIEDAERNAIWTLIQYLTKKGKTPQ